MRQTKNQKNYVPYHLFVLLDNITKETKVYFQAILSENASIFCISTISYKLQMPLKTQSSHCTYVRVIL